MSAYVFIFVCMCLCVCVCVQVLQKLCYGVWLEELDKDSRNEGGANVQAGSTQDAGSQQGHESTEDGSVQSGQAVLGKSKSESREQ